MLDDGSVVDLSANNYIVGMLPERQELKASISAGEKRVGDIDAAIKDAMGSASTAHVPGFVITFKSQYRRRNRDPRQDDQSVTNFCRQGDSQVTTPRPRSARSCAPHATPP
jgi:predicted phage-related endonuclease